MAVSFRDGSAAGLSALADAERDGQLTGYHLLPATRADLLRRLGRDHEAVAYRQALTLVRTGVERRFLQRRWREISRPGAAPTDG